MKLRLANPLLLVIVIIIAVIVGDVRCDEDDYDNGRPVVFHPRMKRSFGNMMMFPFMLGHRLFNGMFNNFLPKWPRRPSFTSPGYPGHQVLPSSAAYRHHGNQHHHDDSHHTKPTAVTNHGHLQISHRGGHLDVTNHGKLQVIHHQPDSASQSSGGDSVSSSTNHFIQVSNTVGGDNYGHVKGVHSDDGSEGNVGGVPHPPPASRRYPFDISRFYHNGEPKPDHMIGYPPVVRDPRRLGNRVGRFGGRATGSRFHGNDDEHRRYAPRSYGGGYHAGHADGYEDAHPEGYQDGSRKGYEDGHDAGYEDAHPVGYEDGSVKGYVKGHEEGHAVGKVKGTVDGAVDGYMAGGAEGFAAGHDRGHHDRGGHHDHHTNHHHHDVYGNNDDDDDYDVPVPGGVFANY